MLRSVAVLLWLACGVAAGATPPIEVPFSDIVKHPRKYNGKRVSMRAYVVTSCTHCGEFWESVEAARRLRARNSARQQWIAIGDFAPGFSLAKSFSAKLRHQQYDGYVQVTGLFQYWPTKPFRERVHPYPKPTPKTDSPDQSYVVVEGSIHYGWGGIDDMQITNITELRPLGPPIPARLE